MPLAGKFFVCDNSPDDTNECSTYHYGEVLEQINDRVYLISIDNAATAAPIKLELVELDEMTMACPSCGLRHWHFFNTHEDRERFISWRQPPENGIVRLVKPEGNA